MEVPVRVGPQPVRNSSMTKEQPSAPQPSQTAGGTVRAISRRPALLRTCPSLYACFGASAYEKIRTKNAPPDSPISAVLHPRDMGILDRLKDTTNQPLRPPGKLGTYEKIRHDDDCDQRGRRVRIVLAGRPIRNGNLGYAIAGSDSGPAFDRSEIPKGNRRRTAGRFRCAPTRVLRSTAWNHNRL